MKFIDCPYCKKLVNASRYPLHCKGKKHQKLESEMLIEDQNLCKDDTDPETTSSSESSQSQSLSEKSI